MPTYWISAAPENGPSRVYLVDAANAVAARIKAHALKFYQKGDEFLIFELPEGAEELALPRNRQLTEAELASVGAEKLGDVDPGLN